MKNKKLCKLHREELHTNLFVLLIALIVGVIVYLYGGFE